MHGHVPAAVSKARSVGRLASSEHLDLALGLPLRNQDELSHLLQELYDPASTNYHRYLTPEQFAGRFGPTEKDYQSLMAFARTNGLSITATHSNRTLLDVKGSVTDIERLLHITLRLYPHPTEARNFYAPDVEPALDLKVPMLAISGLDNYIMPRPMDLVKKPLDQTTNATAYTTGSGPRGNFIGKDFRAAYAPGVSLNGAGQSVGLFELEGFYPGDITAYESLAGLPNVPLTTVLLAGFKGVPGANNDEVALDIDMAIAMAPGLSNVIIYEGTTPNDVLNRMATDNLAKQLSSSWGFPINAATEQIYLQYAAQGQTMFQASGDNGAYSAGVFTPSDDPNLTVVGGTSLTTSGPGGAWLSETVWSGSGGGVSTSNAIPAWQRGVSMSANQGSTTLRNIPDVACLADVVIWLIANNGQQGAIGGTSAAAPLWAGFAALVNQQAASSGKPVIGFINPVLYAIGSGPGYAASFHDITTGNNKNSSSPNKFSAVAGYDLCTGWGTPTGSNLISTLLAPPDSLQITPGTNFIASGPLGGPFNPAAQNFLLTNTGAATLNWSLVNTAAWLDVSPANGTLTPGGPATTVTASLNSAASNLVAGSYPATIWFTNLNDAFGQSRQFTLDIVTLPVITTQPTDRMLPVGSTVMFTVGTATNALLSYQWQENGTNLTDGGSISGSATSALTLTNITTGTAGTYSVIVSNAAGAVPSEGAVLTVTLSPPLITLQPANQTALPGATAIFSVAVVGNAPLSYQWRANTTNLTDGGNISGSTTSSITISNVSVVNAGTYSVIVTNALGSATSTNALLNIIPATTPGTALTTLYSFTGANDGGNPNALIQAANGNFYGTTQNGGTNSAGTVFQMTANGSLTDLYAFTGGNDGASPFARLAQGTDGNFYGTTFQGGLYDNGTVFVMGANGNLTTLLSFIGTNGDLPFAGLTLGVDGNFYGASYQGGANGPGSIYKITSNGSLTTLVSFNDSNGKFPYAGLIQATDGNFYGTTFLGGANGNGTVFKINASGILTTLVSFNITNGANPYAGLVQGDDGYFYGVTAGGGSNTNGTIFKINSAGNFTNLYSFTGGSDGSRPVGGLLLGADGNFYGTTAFGGAYAAGTIFRMIPNGALTTIAQFDGYNGANPQAALTQGADGNIYGTTQNGGAQGNGTIFRLNTTSALQITSQPISQAAYFGSTVTFNIAVIGAPPLAFQWQVNGTNLTDNGNFSGSATRTLTLNNVTANNAATYSVIVSNFLGSAASTNAFLQVIASPPQIIGQPTNLTIAPGAIANFNVAALGNMPLHYQWQLNGTNLTDAGNISGSTTSNLTIINAIEAYNGTFSVIVSNALGSVSSTGAVLAVIPPSAAGTSLATLYSFTGGNDGGNPNALTLGSDGNLYGTTQLAGSHHLGTAFKVTPNGRLTTLVSFGGSNGSIPLSALIQAGDGNFYGTTEDGGNYFSGNVFKLTPGGALNGVYSFTGGSDGSSPVAALVQASDGNFYGTMSDGGINGAGNVFKLMSNGSFANLYSFSGGLNGSAPVNPLVQASDGNFYGTTGGGIHGAGNIFKLSPIGAITNLYSFTGSSDGSVPVGALVQGTDGNLYGATKYSTISGFTFYGTIFKITTNGAFTSLYDLNFNNGSYPSAGLIQGTDGNFYGTTYSGGTSNDGTVFRISPNGTFVTLVSFDGFDDGAFPESALVQGIDGSFYGTTTTGGANGHGTIFRLSVTSAPQITTQPAAQSAFAGANVTFSVAVFGAPPLFYQWRQNGTNLADGGIISGSAARILTLSNITAANAGTYSVIVSNGSGSVISSGALLTVAPSLPIITQQPVGGTALPGSTATLTVAAVGNAPLSYQWRENTVNLTDGGNLSGSAMSSLIISNVSAANAGTYSVIISNSLGSVISTNAILSVAPVSPTGIFLTSLYSFTGGNDGGNPNGLIQATNGNFYGTTVYGGTYGSGTVFQLPPNSAPASLYLFTGGSDGAFPYAALVQGADGNFYGTTFQGGVLGNGSAFKLTPGGALTTLYSFSGGKDGAEPEAALIQGRDGNFYGTASAGGANGHGDLFRLPLSGALTNLHSFTGGNDGSSPAGGVTQGSDSNFYGTTSNGGTNGDGAVFKTSTNGAILWSFSFNITNGANPQAGLTRGNDGNFYGTTAGGGANGTGTIFKITTNGLLTALYSFSSLTSATNSDGAAPQAALVLGSDGNFYGATASGGPYGEGTIFQITPSGVLTALAWFDGFNGANPDSALVQGTDGDFYGTTSFGGAGGAGVIFRLSVPLPLAFQKIMQTAGSITLTWSAAAGQTYQLQYKTSLSSTTWINLGNPVTASNSTVTVTDTIVPGPAQRFYRVVLLP